MEKEQFEQKLQDLKNKTKLLINASLKEDDINFYTHLLSNLGTISYNNRKAMKGSLSHFLVDEGPLISNEFFDEIHKFEDSL